MTREHHWERDWGLDSYHCTHCRKVVSDLEIHDMRVLMQEIDPDWYSVDPHELIAYLRPEACRKKPVKAKIIPTPEWLERHFGVKVIEYR